MDDKVLPTVSRTELTAIINRLEAATSRLEDMASSAIEAPRLNCAAPAPPPTGPLPTPPTISQTPPQPPKPIPEALPESVEDFDALLTGTIKKYVNLSDEIGGPVAEQASAVLRGFVGQRRFILISTKAKKPDLSSEAFIALVSPMQETIAEVGNIRDSNRSSPYFNHLSAVAESMDVLGWVMTEPKPHKHVEESLSTAQFRGNRVLKEFKDKDQKQVDWVKAFYQVFKDLAEYTQQTFPQGIPWNPKGVTVEEASKSSDEAQPNPPTPHPKAAGGPPPPPPPPGPPPPALTFDEPTPTTPANVGGIGAVFNELNKGEAVTKGLRKVNADQMTHKNPSLRAGATVPTRSDSLSSVSSVSRGKSPAPPGKKPKPESMRTKKPPVKKLDGNKWYIEHYDNESEPIEIEASISHSILISRCSKTTIIVKGKANAISIDNCPRLSLVVESLVSSIDVIKASNLALQVLGTLPTILMDQVDGAQVYLGKDSLNTEVFSSKCSSINLLIPEGEEGDYKEVPLPEQMRTFIGESGRIESEIVEHSG